MALAGLDPRSSCPQGVVSPNGDMRRPLRCARKGGGLSESADWAARCAGRRWARRLETVAPARRLTCGGLCARVWGERKRWRWQLGSKPTAKEGCAEESLAKRFRLGRGVAARWLAGWLRPALVLVAGWLSLAGWLPKPKTRPILGPGGRGPGESRSPHEPTESTAFPCCSADWWPGCAWWAIDMCCI